MNTPKQYLAEVSRQVEMALASKNTPEAVKDCLKTIIIEASTEADMTLDDFSLVREALPNIIENLGDDYGRGFLHSIAAIIRFDTDAFQKFYDERLDENAPEIEAKPDTPKFPFVPKENLITKEEIIKFLESIFMETSYEHYVLDGFLFLFNSFSEMANQDQVGAMDLCNEIKSFIYKETIHCNMSEEKYLDSIPKRYRETNYNNKNETITGDVRNEVYRTTPNVETDDLDTLASHLSAAMKNPLMPKHLYNVITDELTENPFDTDSIEWILANLKSQLKKDDE